MNLRPYLEKIDQAYKEARAAYTRTYEDIEALKAKEKALRFGEEGNKYSPEHRNTLLREIDEKIKTSKAYLRTIREDLENAAGKVRAEAEKTFAKKYSVNPGSLDMQLTKLLESGILSDDELLHISDKYNDVTNRRMIAKYVTERGEKTNSRPLKVHGFELYNEQPPHIASLNNFVETAMLGLRDDRVVADGYAERGYPEYAEKAFAAGETITDE